MADPFTISAAGVFSAIGTTFKLAEFCLALKDVDEDNRVFLTLIDRVRKDLNEALRERREKEAILNNMPSKRAWIDESIIDTKSALNNIGIYVESARVDVEQGKAVTLKHRFEWVLNNRQKFITREMALATCHKSLLLAIGAMHTLYAFGAPMPMPMHPPPTLPPPAYNPPPNFLELENTEEDKTLMRPSRRRPKPRMEKSSYPVSIELPAEIETPCLSPISTDFAPIAAPPNEQGHPFRPPYYETQSESSLPTHTNFPSSPNVYAPTLPEIQPTSFSLQDTFSNAEKDRLNTLSVAADALETQGEGIPVMSMMADSIRRSATQERRRRARARFARA